MVSAPTDVELAARHKYRLPSGDVAINVTAVSGCLDLGKAAGMAGAAAKLTKAGLDYRAEWREKADTGTRVHAVCEQWLRGESAEVRDSDQGYVDALEKFWQDYEPSLVECEAIALSHHGYGGRLDMIADLNDGRRLLIDVKTGKQYPTEHCLQMAAYRYADGLAEYGEDGMLHLLRPVPKVDACACLYVRGDGTYSLVEYPSDGNAFAIFLSLLHAVMWAKSEDMKLLEKRAKEPA